jgi:two-component system, cell cycle response regulator
MAGFTILPIGFSIFEKSTIDNFFQLANRRAPHWTITTQLLTAKVVLLSANSQQHVDAIRSLVASWQTVIVVGDSDYGTGWMTLPRPLRLNGILAAINTPESLVETSTAPVRHKFIAPATAIVHKPAVTQAAAKHANVGRALVVDDSETARKYLQNRLHHLGYTTEVAKSAEEALAILAVQPFNFVFMDILMDGLDGYQACKAIKTSTVLANNMPAVIMVSSRGGTLDKIRGSFAGCDAYITKPVNEKRLASLLIKLDKSTLTQRWHAANPRQSLQETFGGVNLVTG